MASSSGIEALVGTWEHVRSENLEDFLKEMGLNMAIRMMAKRSKPRVVISENSGVWTIRTETLIKTMTETFTPGVEFESSTPDGQKLKVLIRFEDGKWIQKMTNQHGKESAFTRFIDDQGLQQVQMTSGDIKACRWFKRAN